MLSCWTLMEVCVCFLRYPMTRAASGGVAKVFKGKKMMCEIWRGEHEYGVWILSETVEVTVVWCFRDVRSWGNRWDNDRKSLTCCEVGWKNGNEGGRAYLRSSGSQDSTWTGREKLVTFIAGVEKALSFDLKDSNSCESCRASFECDETR